jgi:hypothetical protein
MLRLSFRQTYESSEQIVDHSCQEVAEHLRASLIRLPLFYSCHYEALCLRFYTDAASNVVSQELTDVSVMLTASIIITLMMKTISISETSVSF